jgi:hypothetical protein
VRRAVIGSVDPRCFGGRCVIGWSRHVLGNLIRRANVLSFGGILRKGERRESTSQYDD